MNGRGAGAIGWSSGWRSALIVAAYLALSSVGIRPAWARALTVDLLASPGSRLADDLLRELGASGFAVLLTESTAATSVTAATSANSGWRAEVKRLLNAPARQGVVVHVDEDRMAVFTRGVQGDQPDREFDQRVDPPRDRMARRRACLAVVEYLRVLSETASADATTRGTGAHDTSSARPEMASPPRWTAATVPAGGGESSPADAVDQHPGRRWAIGAGSTLGLEAAPGGPTGHLQFTGYLPLEWRMAVCLRALWPILGGQFRTDGNDVRTWGFGGGVSLHYRFGADEISRVRPFIGIGLGTRIILTETTPANAMQSRETFTPGMTFGAEGGVRYALSPLVQLFFEVGVGRGWLLPGVRRADYEQAAANAASLHASFGLLFEI